MTSATRRYVFIDYASLQKVKISQLKAASNRVFVFIDAERDQLPLSFVKELQKIGKRLKWIIVKESINQYMDFHIIFLLGLLHNKVDKDIEFAVLSDEPLFDPLLKFISDKGRSCIRVTRKKQKGTKATEPIVLPVDDGKANTPSPSGGGNGSGTTTSSSKLAESVIKSAAKQTVQRLNLSSKRPHTLGALREFILQNNEASILNGEADDVIRYLVLTNEMQLEGEEVIYSF